MSRLTNQIDELKKCIQDEGIVPENRLGDELFLFASTLMPVVNVDLLVFNDKDQVLLSWRNDPHCGCGWHVPGGCLRFKETLENRVHKTAINEFGVDVEMNSEAIGLFEIFSPNFRDGIEDQRERAHFITIVYECKLLEELKNNRIEVESGNLKWFDELPENLLNVQDCYKQNWSYLINRRKSNNG